MPLKEIVIHQQGIAYFNKSLLIPTNETKLNLNFKSIYMDDILKSIQVIGDGIESITYDSQKEKISANTITELLKDARESYVTIESDKGKKISGKVIGIETFDKKYILSVINDDGLLQKINVLQIESLKFMNEKFKTKNITNVSINVKPSTDIDRSMSIFYLQSFSAWKTTYRIQLKDDNESIDIKLWGIIDNTSDEDWSDVKITLVSGFPITFITPIYKTIQNKRSIIKPNDNYIKKSKQEPLHMFESASVSKSKLVEQVGTFVEYKLDSVTVKNNESITLPIFEGSVKGKEILVYNESISKYHPMTSIEIKNTTNITLATGPATILDNNGKYLGETLIKTFVPDKIDSFPFKLEQRIEINNSNNFAYGKIHEIKIESGVLIQSKWEIKTTKYLIKSYIDPITLFIDHCCVNINYELFETIKPLSNINNIYRFQIDLKKGDNEFIVKERTLLTSKITINPSNFQLFDVWLENELITEDLFNKLVFIKKLYNELEETKNRINNNLDKQNRLERIQERSRKNKEVLGDTEAEKELKNKIIQDLLKTTKELEELSNNIDLLKDLQKKQDDRYKKALSEISFSNKIKNQSDQELVENKNLLKKELEINNSNKDIQSKINEIDEELKERLEIRPFSTLLKKNL